MPFEFRQSRHPDIGASLAALVLTGAAFAAILSVSGNVMTWRGTTRVAEKSAQEEVVFVARPLSLPRLAAPLPAARAVHAGNPRAGVTGAVDSSILPPEARADSASARPEHATAVPTRVSPMLVPSLGRPDALAPKPIEIKIHDPFAPARLPTEAERLAMAESLAMVLPRAARTRELTTAEKDSIMGDVSRAATIPGRKGQVPGSANGGFGVPLLSPGPSAAERKRDKAANTEYLAILERLQARVRQRRDSIIADSLRRRR